MANIDRRTFLRASTAVAAGAIAPDLALATDNNNKELMASPSTTTPEVTKIVARYVVSARYEDLPANVRKEGIRTLLNWVGVAVGGSYHETNQHQIKAAVMWAINRQVTSLVLELICNETPTAGVLD